jgi:hypothetical protein
MAETRQKMDKPKDFNGTTAGAILSQFAAAGS